ncbi:MAG: LysR substrate-binding domain-containing protein [Actinomycetota bacterium]
MINLRHLETFLVVADELHFGRAANRLHVAQPAVSQTIAALEAEVGVKLFDRSSRVVRLTAAGSAYVDEVEEIFRQITRANTSARLADEGVRGHLTVAFTAVCALGFLPGVVVDFIGQNPEVDVELRQLGTAEQIDALSIGAIDVGFSILPESHGPVHSRLLTPDELHLFIPADDPLAALDRISVADAITRRFLLLSREREPCVRKTFDRLCDAHAVEGDVVMEIDHLESLLAFVGAGLGVSLAPSVAAALQLDGVQSRPLDPPVPSGISAIWDPDETSPTAQRFLDHLCAAIDDAGGLVNPSGR